LRETEIPEFEKIFESDNFGNNDGLVLEQNRQEDEVWKKIELAERQIKLAEKRLKTV
jgi:hypothetical protein